MQCNLVIATLAHVLDKTGKEGKNADNDDATSVMSFESSVVSHINVIHYAVLMLAPVRFLVFEKYSPSNSL